MAEFPRPQTKAERKADEKRLRLEELHAYVQSGGTTRLWYADDFKEYVPFLWNRYFSDMSTAGGSEIGSHHLHALRETLEASYRRGIELPGWELIRVVLLTIDCLIFEALSSDRIPFYDEARGLGKWFRGCLRHSGAGEQLGEEVQTIITAFQKAYQQRLAILKSMKSSSAEGGSKARRLQDSQEASREALEKIGTYLIGIQANIRASDTAPKIAGWIHRTANPFEGPDSIDPAPEDASLRERVKGALINALRIPPT